MPDTGSERVRLPQVVTLESCGPSRAAGKLNGYKVVSVANDLRIAFAQGADVVRVQYPLERLPDYGGRSSGKQAILPHVDHFGDPDDPREVLFLSKLAECAEAGSPTVIADRAAAPLFLAVEEEWFLGNRDLFGNERNYDLRFKILKGEYDRCFDEASGYEQVVQDVLSRNPGFDPTITRLNILGYLMRGPSADDVMRDVMERCKGTYVEESWEDVELIALRNSLLLHGRKYGPRTPRQRNFGVF